MDTVALLDELNCSICLNIYRDPVALRCGHSFCRVCITSFLETHKSSKTYKCPRCRKQFEGELSVQENISLRHIADHFLSTQPKQEDTGIICNYCIHSQVPAVKTCVLCEASLCDNHVKVHSKSSEHVLSDPTTSLESRKCSVHNEILKYFCSDDNVCICATCSIAGDHKGHQVEVLPEAAVKMKETLKEDLEKLISKKNKTKESLQVLQKSKTMVPETVADIRGKVINVLKNIREQLDGLEIKALTQLSTLEEKTLKGVSNLIQKLEEIQEDLTKEIADTEELCEMTDPLSVLQACETSMDEVEEQETNITDEQICSAGKLDEGLVLETLHIGFCDIMTDIKKHLQMYEETNITLNANTASPNVMLSSDCKSVSKNNQNMNCYRGSQSFKQNDQVLSLESLSWGRCYWDVDTQRADYWIIGVSYSSIDREGPKSWIGSNNKSWGIHRAGYTYFARHNGEQKQISLTGNLGQGQRIRVYVDHGAGRLSFYELSDPIQHLHTFNATFTEALHVALCVYNSIWIRILS